MARTNKYTSINFNDLFEKKSSSSSNSNTNKNKQQPTSTTSLRNHGGMLVLTRPSPKPIQIHQPIEQKPEPEPEPEPESISLRPLGRTGSSTLTPTTQEREKEVVPVFKPEPFVPPHLRPGFVGKEEKLVGQNGQRNIGPVNTSNNNDENGRPKSGGGYERMRRNGGYGGMEYGDVNRPRSSSGSGGRYGSSTHF